MLQLHSKQLLSAFWAKMREYKVYDMWFQELSVGCEADICSQIAVAVPLDGWWQYLCLLSQARLNDSSCTTSCSCGSAWHLDLTRGGGNPVQQWNSSAAALNF